MPNEPEKPKNFVRKPDVQVKPEQKPHKQPIQVYSGSPWKCEICHSILGFTDDKKEILRIKYKDFYCYIKSAVEVTVLCRKCGHLNTVNSK